MGSAGPFGARLGRHALKELGLMTEVAEEHRANRSFLKLDRKGSAFLALGARPR
jgi:hypothetical protein